jgi:hypothetical protein
LAKVIESRRVNRGGQRDLSVVGRRPVEEPRRQQDQMDGTGRTRDCPHSDTPVVETHGTAPRRQLARLDALGSTLPYFDIVVTDKAAASHARRTGLADRLGTTVLSRLDDLIALL